MILRVAILFCLFTAGLMAAEHEGMVTSQGVAIPGASVTATLGDQELATATDETGRYRFESLTPGVWTLEVKMFGFEEARREVSVTESAEEAAAPTEEIAILKWEIQLSASARTAPPPDPPAARGAPALRQRIMNQVEQADLLQELSAAPEGPAISELAQNATESFLITGSLSRGLQLPGQADGLRGPGGLGFPGPAGGGPFGPGDGESLSAGGGPFAGAGSGPPGRGGGPGAFGGRGGLGPRGGGPRAGRPGGRGGRGGPGGDRRARIAEWQRRRGTMQFGNRINAGRDTLRGMALFSLGNSALDARPYSLTGETVDKPSYAQSNFGVGVGGPLRIPKLIDDEKTFFFANYRGSRSRNPFNAFATVPSVSERLGDFSQSVARGPVSVYDPGTGRRFTNNQVPASLIDSAAQGLLEFIPLQNQPGRVQNYQFVTSFPQNSDNLGVRVNRSISERDRLAFSYNLQRRNSETVQLFGFRDTSEGRGQNASLGWTHNFSSQLISNLRLTFSRNRNELIPFFAFQEDVAGTLGIGGTSNDPLNYGPPNLSFTNFGDLTDGSPSLRRDQTLGLSEGITLVRGNHTWSLGGEYRRLQLNSLSQQNARGAFSFGGLATSLFDEQGLPQDGTGFDFADFLLGFPQSSTIRFGNPDTYFRGRAYNFYLQDDWRVRTNLSVNIGLRYEFLSPFREKYDRLANLDVARGFMGVAAVTPGGSGPYTGTFPEALIDPDRNNFAPRIGIAWKPNPNRSLLVRAGYGWYYNGSVYNQAANRLAQQPPFATTGTLTTSLQRTLTIQDGFALAPSAQISNTFAVARGYLVGYAQTWNFAVQHDLPYSMVLEAGYLGTKGTRLDVQRSPNRAAPGSPLTAEERRQIGNAVGFTYDNSEGNSVYHAGQARLTRRFRGGISMNALYTWSKSIDNVSTFGGGAAVVAQNDRDLSAERGLSSFDQRHSLRLFYVFNSPFGGASFAPPKGWVGRFFKDWSLSGGLTLQSGQPFTATVLGNQANAAGSGLVGSGRADATGLPVDQGEGFFNPAAFTIPPADRFGNAARNTIPGPGLFSLNLGVGRRFRLGDDRRSLELRVESTNLTNTVSYSRLATTVNASNFGLATGAASMRTMRLTARLRF